jgi:5-methylcytosine-specific restriction endonuclease McrA
MTGRTIPEWIGKTPDTPAPPRVRLRVWDAASGRCAICGRKIGAGERWECDHIVALANGGENRESNLRVLCCNCHKIKTRGDVAEKAKIARIRKKHIGITKPKHQWPKRKFCGYTSNVRDINEE